MEAEDRISGNLAENRRLMDRILRTEKSFDIVYRPVKAAGRQAGFYFVDGMVKDEILPLAIAFVPMQQFGETFSLCQGLQAGTIFPELCLPFCGKGGACR